MAEVVCDTRWVGSALVARLSGEIDAATEAAYFRLLDAAASGPPRPALLVVDLRAVRFVAAAGVAMLLRIGADCAAHATRTTLLTDPASHLTKVLDVLAVTAHLPVHHRLEDALS